MGLKEIKKKERKGDKEIDKKFVRCLGMCMRVHFYACVSTHVRQIRGKSE